MKAKHNASILTPGARSCRRAADKFFFFFKTATSGSFKYSSLQTCVVSFFSLSSSLFFYYYYYYSNDQITAMHRNAFYLHNGGARAQGCVRCCDKPLTGERYLGASRQLSL